MQLGKWTGLPSRCRREYICEWLNNLVSSCSFKTGNSPTSRVSRELSLRTVRGVFPLSLPGVLNISATLLELCQSILRAHIASTYTWFLLKISAICSLSQSTSFRAENVNSSVSAVAICREEALSSAIHGAEPTCRRALPRIVAIMNQNNG